jgi:hypothetical protein
MCDEDVGDLFFLLQVYTIYRLFEVESLREKTNGA